MTDKKFKELLVETVPYATRESNYMFKHAERKFIMDLIDDLKDVHTNYDSDPDLMYTMLEMRVNNDRVRALSTNTWIVVVRWLIGMEMDPHTFFVPGLDMKVRELRTTAAKELHEVAQKENDNLGKAIGFTANLLR